MSMKQTDNPKNPIGVDSADNQFSSSSVAANADGSILERLEYVQTVLSTIDGLQDVPTADSADNAQARDVIGNKTDTTGGNSLISLVKIIDGIVDTINTNVSTVDTNVDIIIGNGNVLKTTIADGTTIPNNTQDAAGLLATASGDVLIEEITSQRGATDFAGPTNYEFSTDNANGLTGAANPNVTIALSGFTANNTAVATVDGSVKQVPFILEDGKKLYVHGDDAATSAGGTTDFYIKYKGIGTAAASIT